MTDRRSDQSSNDQLAFAVLPDEAGGYEVPDGYNRGPMILALALGVIAVFGVVVWNAYKQGVRQSNSSALPQIASEGAFKSKPINPGGRADINTELHVLDQVGGSAREESAFNEIEVREEPVPVVENVAVESNAINGLSSKAVVSSVPQSNNSSATRQIGKSGTPVDLRPGAKAPGSTIQTAQITPRPTIKRPPAQTSADINVTPIQTPKPRASVPKPASIGVNFSVDGTYVVQLAAVKSSDAVGNIWDKASKNAPKLFENANRHVQTVDLGPKGVWHRVQAGSFDSRADANVFCKAYKAKGGDCIVALKK